jgi:uncharacterized protein YhbP (UPF0306 family)
MSGAKCELELIATLLHEESALSLATVDENGEAWVAPLYYIPDADLALCWLSSRSSLHSVNLARNSKASATVYRHAETWREIRGLQMRGQVSVVTQRERRRTLIERYRERFQLGALFRAAISQCTLYVFRPEFFRYLDNSRRFGYRFELIREDSDWECFPPAAVKQRDANSALPS